MQIRLTESGLLRVAGDVTMLLVALYIGYEVMQWRAYVRQQPLWWWHDALVDRIVTAAGPRAGCVAWWNEIAREAERPAMLA